MYRHSIFKVRLNPNYPTESRSGKKFHSTYVMMTVVLLFN